MAFTQADVERDLYMELPKNFSVPGTKITHAETRTNMSSS
jgi:hypothetical protein